MYCNVPQVNQLTALLAAHGIRHIVVCPGSRNATIVHDLNERPDLFELYPVTDERSAGFVALGLTLATDEAAAVCVTSGSALLGCLPAVAEAWYRHRPLLVISADRPPEWIGQLDGQTLPQSGALEPYCHTSQLALPHTDSDHTANNRRINLALLSLHSHGGRPAHINIPIAEPMFGFTTPTLPDERVIREYEAQASSPLPDGLIREIAAARLPALLLGQYERGDLRSQVNALDSSGRLLVLPEVISDVAGCHRMGVLDSLTEGDAALVPDLIVQVGGNFVHKRFKQLFRQGACRVIRLTPDREELPDTFAHLTDIVRCSEVTALEQLVTCLPPRADIAKIRDEYDHRGLLAAASLTRADEGRLTYTAVMRALQTALHQQNNPCSLHLGNSTAVRAAARVMASGDMPIYCNRGVNGIEGSLSTAVGYALGMWGLTIAVLGDLSFFYDCNALWNVRLPRDLRVLLVNDGHGGIFDHLPGLQNSPARDPLIAAGSHRYTARGIAASYELDYRSVDSLEALPEALSAWLKPSKRASLLEVQLP